MQNPSEILKTLGPLSADEYHPFYKGIETACTNLTREDLEKLVVRLSQEADTDFLTGLLNFRGLCRCGQPFIAQCRLEGKPVAMIAFDLDKFKCANDTKGHLTGDNILRQVAVALIESTRLGDIKCRKGGDEFALIASLSMADVYDFVEQIRERVFLYTQRYYDDGISISAGVATTDHSGHDWRLCTDAFDALKKAKQRGGNQIRVAA
jgi:diguanylate cyclase (GGDEF)-like protein